MTDHGTPPAVWRKSSRSGSTGGECVEVAALDSRRFIRDSKNPAKGFLTVRPGAWNTLLTEIKQRAYDL